MHYSHKMTDVSQMFHINEVRHYEILKNERVVQFFDQQGKSQRYNHESLLLTISNIQKGNMANSLEVLSIFCSAENDLARSIGLIRDPVSVASMGPK
ncbi:MAG TPA: hypothetical protein VIY47_08220 [Ignavibacteriaceae bacterium]